jgi:hypothetical protein
VEVNAEELMKLARLALVSALVCTGAVGCASRSKQGAVQWTDGPSAPMLTVQNDNWLDVVVYVVRGASRFRVGTVRSTSTETFRLKSEGLGGSSPLRIMADPIGSKSGYVTDQIVLTAGQRLEVRVGSPINISSFSVWSQ